MKAQTDAWMCGIAVVLSFITVASVVATIILAILGETIVNTFLALGFVAVAGFARLLFLYLLI